MIKVTLKGIKGTISEHYFDTWDDTNRWLDSVPYDENGAIGYILENIEENEKYIDTINDLFTEFNEMGYAPTTLCENPEKEALSWIKRLRDAIELLRRNKEVGE